MKKAIFTGLTAIAVLASACSSDNSNENNGPDMNKGSIRISINGGNASTRAAGNPSADEEKTVNSFTVYVFNYSSGVLEIRETFTDFSEGYMGTINGLSVASQKRVVVFVNQPAGFPAISSYSDLSDASTMIGLETQVTPTNLFMSGEAAGAVTLSLDDVVSVPVTVSRLVAKVRLASLNIIPADGLSIDDFALTGVSMQKARDKADAMGILRTTGFRYVGGVQLAGDESLRADYLDELYSLPGDYTGNGPLTPQIYFYVFANDNTDGESTMMNIYGAYKGNPMYFPFYINNEAGSGGSTTDGNWIERNKIYNLNVTLRKLGGGGTDPNLPNEEVSMEVVVNVADWEDELTQNVEW